MKYFRELNLEILRDKVVVLDIDGTICYDKHHTIEEKEQIQLDKLKDVSQNIFLVSNGDKTRTQELAQLHEIMSHISEYQKPHRKVLHAFPHVDKNDIVVVGDKFVTDGLLAIQTGVPFLHVKSLVRESEGVWNRFVFWTDDMVGTCYELLRACRPKQWIKNVLVFAPVFFAGEIFKVSAFIDSWYAFLIFSLTASIVYILNDINDKESDRVHHKKKFRPIASYNLRGVEALSFALALIILVFVLLAKVPAIFNLILLYVVSNLAYTLKFKNIPSFDTVFVASMYVMRVVAGGLAASIFVSPWIISCTFFAALFIISAKRYVEFQNPTRKVLKRYAKETLQGMLFISATLSIIGYVLYTILGSRIHNVLYTSVFVITVFLIMLNDVFMGNRKLETPEIYLLTNKHILVVILAWVLAIFFLIYGV